MKGYTMPKGRYIAFEGDEGSGKSTQIEATATYLRGLGIGVETLREPGGDPFGEDLRKLLLFADYEISPLSQVYAFCAIRANLLNLKVAPKTEEGTWVLTDRSYLSTLVYQGLGYGLDPCDGSPASLEFRRLCEFAVSAAPLDAMIILDIPLEVSAQRLSGRQGEADRFETQKDDFRRLINNGYRYYGQFDGHTVIDGVGTEAEVQDRVRKAIHALAAGYLAESDDNRKAVL